MRETDGSDVDRDLPLPIRAAASSSTDPATAPGRWTKPPPSLKGRRRGAVVLGIGLSGYLVFGTVAGTHGWSSIFVAATTQSLMYVGLLWLGIGNSPNTEDFRLLEDPDDPDVCLVSLRIVSAGRTVGRDRGVVWFEDGRLLYSGHRTSFALGGEDIAPRGERHAYAREFGSVLPDEAVPLRIDETKVVILKPLARKSDVGNRQEMRFLKALYAFKRNPPRSFGPRQWPPLEPWSDRRDGANADVNR